MNNNLNIVTSKYLVFYKRISSDNKIVMNNLLTSEECLIDELNIELLKRCQKVQCRCDLVHLYGENIINDYINRRILLDQAVEWEQNYFWQAEIEIGTFCDFACRFCPVSVSVQKNKVMSMDLYNRIIKELNDLESMKYVSFSLYNEPLLDPFFEQRVRALCKTNLKLRLATNTSLLNKEKIQFLVRANVVDLIKINIPSVDANEYIRLTGTNMDTYKRVMKNIDLALDSGIKITLAVNGTKKELSANYDAINQKYKEKLIEKPNPVDTRDRCGFLKNEYYQNISIKEKLTGFCFRPLTWLIISVDGNLCLCCNDYEQKHVYGNIYDGSLKELINSEKAQSLRKQVYGYKYSDNDFVCRHCEYMQRGKLFKRYNPLRDSE